MVLPLGGYRKEAFLRGSQQGTAPHDHAFSKKPLSTVGKDGVSSQKASQGATLLIPGATRTFFSFFWTASIHTSCPHSASTMSGLYLGLALDKVHGISKSCCVALHTALGLLGIINDSRLHMIRWILSFYFYFYCSALLDFLRESRRGRILEDSTGMKTPRALK